jgi:hypothetical protein
VQTARKTACAFEDVSAYHRVGAGGACPDFNRVGLVTHKRADIVPRTITVAATARHLPPEHTPGELYMDRCVEAQVWAQCPRGTVRSHQSAATARQQTTGASDTDTNFTLPALAAVRPVGAAAGVARGMGPGRRQPFQGDEPRAYTSSKWIDGWLRRRRSTSDERRVFTRSPGLLMLAGRGCAPTHTHVRLTGRWALTGSRHVGTPVCRPGSWSQSRRARG